MQGTDAVKALSYLRIGIGAGAWLTPRLAGRLFGLDPAGNPQLPYVARLFGVRDLALGLGLLGSEGEARRRWLELGAACDGADTLAALMAGARGNVGPLTTVMLVAPAVGALALGVSALGDTGSS